MIVIALVASFIFSGMVSGIIGKFFNVEDFVNNLLGEDLKSLSTYIMPIIEMLIKLLGFIIAFVVLRVITFLIFKIFKNIGKKDEKPAVTSRLIGGALGVVSGIIFVLFILCPLNGTLRIAGTLLETVNDVQASGDSSSENELMSKLSFLTEFKEENISVTLDKIGGKIVAKISSVKDENGKELTLTGQVEAIQATGKMAAAMSEVSKIDFSNPEDIKPEDIKDLFNSLNNIKDGLSDEALDTVNGLIKDVAGDLLKDVNIDLSGFDMSEIDFSAEGEIIADLLSEDTDLADVAKAMADSELITDLLSGVDATFETSEEEKAEIIASLNEVENLDAEKKNQIYALFGIK